MQKQNNLHDTIKKLKCIHHSEPITFACIQKQCKVKDRLFCLQCNDQIQFTVNTHILVSLKKFNQIFLKYKDYLVNDQKLIALQKIQKIKINLKNSLESLENFIQSDQKILNIEGQQEQIVRGRIQSLLQNLSWENIFKMQNEKKSEFEISQKLEMESKKRNVKFLEALDNLQIQVNNEIQNAMRIFKYVNPPNNKFSLTKKHDKLQLYNQQLKIKNTSDYGHYFCQLENDFDVNNSKYTFCIQKQSPQSTIWLGFTFPYISQQYKWTNIYDPRKGTFCIAIYENGKQINFWSSDKDEKQQIKFDQIEEGSKIQLMIDFYKKQFSFNWISQGKCKCIKKLKPIEWKGKVFPVVGFCGKSSILQII